MAAAALDLETFMMSVRDENWNMRWFRRSRSFLVTRADLRAIYLRGSFPPVLLLAVCFILAMIAQRDVTKERTRGLKPPVRATHLAGADVRCADDGSRRGVRTSRVGDKCSIIARMRRYHRRRSGLQ